MDQSDRDQGTSSWSGSMSSDSVPVPLSMTEFVFPCLIGGVQGRDCIPMSDWREQGRAAGCPVPGSGALGQGHVAPDDTALSQGWPFCSVVNLCVRFAAQHCGVSRLSFRVLCSLHPSPPLSSPPLVSCSKRPDLREQNTTPTPHSLHPWPPLTKLLSLLRGAHAESNKKAKREQGAEKESKKACTSVCVCVCV